MQGSYKLASWKAKENRRIERRFLFVVSRLLLLRGEGRDAGEDLAFEELEGGAAAGGDVAHLGRLAGLLDRGDRVAAADDRRAAVRLDRRDRVADAVGALGERRELEAAHRAVPDDRLGALDGLAEERDRLRTDVKAHPAVRDVALDRLHLDVGRVLRLRELVRDDAVDRQEDLDALRRRGLEHLLAVGDLLVLAERVADLEALGLLEGVGHAAADDEGVDLVEERLHDRKLVRDLRTAEDGDERTNRILDRVAEELDLLLQEEARDGGLDVVRDDGRRGVGAVGRAERVVAVEVAVAGELLGHLGALRLELGLLRGELLVREVDALLLVVLLHLAVLGLVEAGVLEERDLARLEGLDDLVGGHAVGDELDGEAELLRERLGDRLQRERGIALVRRLAELDALRAAEVAHEDQAAALLEDVLDGRERRHDAGVVRNLARAVLGHRNVEINTHDDALALEVDVAKSLLVHFLSFLSD